MSKFVGKLAKFGFAKEATRGVAEAEGNALYTPHLSLEMDDKIEVIKDESSAGVLAGSTGSAVSQKYAEGSFEGKIGDKTVGLPLTALFGQAPTSVANGDGTYTHSFNFVQNSQHQSLSFFLADEVQDYVFANGMISSIEFNAELGKHATINADIIAKAGVEANLNPAYSAENDFVPGMIEVKMADNVAGLDAATKICVKNFSLSVDKGVERDQCLGDADINDILNGVIEITGSMELLYQNKNMHDILVQDTEKAIRLSMENGAVNIGSGSTHPKLEIDLNKVKFTDVSKGYDNASMTTVSVEFEAHYKVADGKIMSAELVNDKTSY